LYGTGEIDQGGQINMQIYPNPSTGSVQISYYLKDECKAELSFYNIHGQKLFTLVNKKQAAGEHIELMDGKSLQGGVYIISLQAGPALTVARLVITN